MTASLGFKVRQAVVRTRTAHAKLNQLRTTGRKDAPTRPKPSLRSRAVGLSLTVREAAGHVFGRGLDRYPTIDVNTGGGRDGR